MDPAKRDSTTVVNRRYRSGDPCDDSGWYVFDGYLDGSLEPLPALSELEIPLEAGAVFPTIHSSNRRCFWRAELDSIQEIL